MPRILNPKKGYIVAANNKQVPAQSIDDVGAAGFTTARAQRIEELLGNIIESGRKATLHDMKSIQMDVKDLYARDVASKLLIIAERSKSLLPDD
jgi:penicillin G amidase